MTNNFTDSKTAYALNFWFEVSHNQWLTTGYNALTNDYTHSGTADAVKASKNKLRNNDTQCAGSEYF